MALFQGLLAAIFKSAGKVLNTAFGWATGGGVTCHGCSMPCVATPSAASTLSRAPGPGAGGRRQPQYEER
jgi:hypothetical protein